MTVEREAHIHGEHAAEDHAAEEHAAEECVIGVDFGTLSGRAVVVRVRDGAELGAATWTSRTGSSTDSLPDADTAAAGLGAAGPRRTTSRCSRHAVPEALRAAGSTRSR